LIPWKRNFRLARSLWLGLVLVVLIFSYLSADSPSVHCVAGADDWSMFHHDAGHSGYSTSTAPNTNQTLWILTTASIIPYGYPDLRASPAVVEGKVYVGAEDGNVYCLNALTGAYIWNYTTGWVYSSPAVADGRVYVGSSFNKLYCLNATNGTYIWSYTNGNPVYSSPVVADGKVYLGTWDNEIYCLDATTGAHIWSYLTGGEVASSPAVANGKVYAGSFDRKVYCLNATNGAHMWNYTTGGLVVSSPAVADGKVYVGSYDNKTYCLNAATGAYIWNYTTGSYIISSPAVFGGKVYIGSFDWKVYCLNAATGTFIWSYKTGASVDSSPAVADGKVYVGSWDYKVYCLNAATGVYIWSYKTGNWVESSPAVANGKVYATSYDGKVYAFGLPTLGDFDGLFKFNTVRMVYPSDSTNKPLGRGAAMLSDWIASAIVYTKLTSVSEDLDTNPSFVNQATGNPYGNSCIGIITFGGPDVNLVTYYAETQGYAPLCFVVAQDRFYFKLKDGTSIPGADLPISVINHDQDMFVIEFFEDQAGRFFMICQGFGWKGTYAAGKYFERVLYPSLESSQEGWFIVKWVDTNGNGFVNGPNEGDTYTLIAAG